MAELNTFIIKTIDPVFAQRKSFRANSAHGVIWQVLDQVFDPELPGLTIWDLGVLQNVQLLDGQWHIDITPTYSGCPAVETMDSDIVTAMLQAGYDQVKVNVVLAPPWSTDMMSPAGKAHLKSIQIAPPHRHDQVCCPVCDSKNTVVVSQFGSTACKALYQCKACQEHFDYFKHF
jgi:ring-1,2-phenylacetyl-CoA epoxidase subunit PaaD